MHPWLDLDFSRLGAERRVIVGADKRAIRLQQLRKARVLVGENTVAAVLTILALPRRAAEACVGVVVGRVVEGKCFVGIKSSRELAFWMKKNGFTVVRNSQMNRYFWPRQEPDTHGEANLS